jgi:hypothetical protein
MTTQMTCETKKRRWDNYRFTSWRELHIYSLRAILSPYLWRLICRCNWISCRNRGGILDVSRKFCRKISAALGFLSGVIAFLSSLIVTMTCLHISVPLCFNVNVSSFLLLLSFMILIAKSIVAPVVLRNGLPRMRGIWWQTSILSTMKSTGMKELPSLTGITSAIPTRHQIC